MEFFRICNIFKYSVGVPPRTTAASVSSEILAVIPNDQSNKCVNNEKPKIRLARRKLEKSFSLEAEDDQRKKS